MNTEFLESYELMLKPIAVMFGRMITHLKHKI